MAKGLEILTQLIGDAIAAGVARELRNRMFQGGQESAGFAGLQWMYKGLDLANLFD